MAQLDKRFDNAASTLTEATGNHVRAITPRQRGESRFQSAYAIVIETATTNGVSIRKRKGAVPNESERVIRVTHSGNVQYLPRFAKHPSDAPVSLSPDFDLTFFWCSFSLDPPHSVMFIQLFYLS